MSIKVINIRSKVFNEPNIKVKLNRKIIYSIRRIILKLFNLIQLRPISKKLYREKTNFIINIARIED